MSKKSSFKHKLFEDVQSLPKDIQSLLSAAKDQLKMAYAPYSNFMVGAAALLDDGQVFTGCNQENASYPLCICAERVALYNIGTSLKDFKIKALAITAHNPTKALTEPVMPCGACRQVIQEFEARQGSAITMYLTSDCAEVMRIKGISKILPHSFSMDHLM